MEGHSVTRWPTIAGAEATVINAGASAKQHWPPHSGHVVLLPTPSSDIQTGVSHYVYLCGDQIIIEICNTAGMFNL